MFAARVLLVSVCIFAFGSVQADDLTVHSFERKQLTGTYFSEGAGAGDINGDGVADVVYEMENGRVS